MSVRTSVRTRELRVSPAVVSAELDNEGVLLNVETGVYFGLGEAEQEIWTLLTQGATEDEIFQALADEYDVDPARLNADLSAFLETLEKNHLIETVD